MNYDKLLEVACGKIETTAEARKSKEAENSQARIDNTKARLLELGAIEPPHTWLGKEIVDDKPVDVFSGMVTICPSSIHSFKLRAGLYCVEVANACIPSGAKLIGWNTEYNYCCQTIYMKFKYHVRRPE
jgi:hypothetical protein